MAKPWAKKFYNSKAWKATREAYFKDKFGICEICGESGEEVHHKTFLTEDNIKDGEIALGWDNLQLLCKNCHNDVHKKAYFMSIQKKYNVRRNKPVRTGLVFDEEGNLVERTNVHIVYGCPGSGKTTYVKEHMNMGDMVIDLDLIKQAISMQGKTEATDNLLDISMKVRDLLYDLVSARDVDTDNVWVIAGLPRKEERDQLATKLKTNNLIYIEATKEECIERAKKDKDRKDKLLQEFIINKWWERYEA